MLSGSFLDRESALCSLQGNNFHSHTVLQRMFLEVTMFLQVWLYKKFLLRHLQWMKLFRLGRGEDIRSMILEHTTIN